MRQKLISFGRDQNFIALNYLIFSIFIASIAVGINVIAFPAILISNNISSFLIGFSSTNEIIFGLIGSIFIARIAKKTSVIKSAVAISIIYASTIFAIFFYKNYYLWLFLSGLTGASWVCLYVIRQAWINSIISDKNRSLILALISTFFCIGFIIGTFIVKHYGALNHKSFMVSSSLILLSVLMLILVKKTQPQDLESPAIKIKDFVKKLPSESLARFLLDLQIATIVCLGVLFGTKIGLSIEDSGFLLAGLMVSGLFDLYAGFLVKRFNRHNMILLGFCGALISILIGAIFYKIYAILWISFMFLGAFSALIMIATLTIVNESFKKSDLIAANGTFQAIGSIGSICGCLFGGILIQIFDFYGFFALIIFTNLLYLTFIIAKKQRNIRYV